MIAFALENAFAQWFKTVADPAGGELEFRAGPGPGVVVPLRRGADAGDRPDLVLIVDAVDEVFTQDPIPLPNFRGTVLVTFRFPADGIAGAESPVDAARAVATEIDKAIHRPDLADKLTAASNGDLIVYGCADAIAQQINFDGRYWVTHWRVPLYSTLLTGALESA